MKNLFTAFNKLTSSDNPASSTRWVFLFTAILSNLVVWLTWLGLSIYNGTVLDIPMGVWMTYGIANGVASVAKVVQKNIEGKPNGVTEPVEEVDNGK